MKNFTYVLYVCLIIHFYSAIAINQSVNHVDPLKKYVDNYAKHMVYMWGSKESYWYFATGVIISNDVILSSFTEIDFKYYGHVVVGAKAFGEIGKGMKIFNIVNMGFRSIELPQINLIQLRDTLTLNKNVSVMPLIERQLTTTNEICVTLSYIKANEISKLHARRVTIEHDCGEGIICFKYYGNINANHCEEYASGEPIICAGVLVGIVGQEKLCDKNELHKATSVYHYLRWIKVNLGNLRGEILAIKSDCRTYVHENFSVFSVILYLLVKTTFNIFMDCD